MKIDGYEKIIIVDRDGYEEAFYTNAPKRIYKRLIDLQQTLYDTRKKDAIGFEFDHELVQKIMNDEGYEWYNEREYKAWIEIEDLVFRFK